MSSGADVRGFYAAIGIDLPGWGDRYVSVRCFAEPEDHTNGDRTASMSISLTTGRYRCFGCGAWGDGYDAAAIAGRTPRHAMELLKAYGLKEHDTSEGHTARPAHAQHTHGPRRNPVPQPAPPPPLRATDEDVRRWASKLSQRPTTIARLACERGWKLATMVELEVGVNGEGWLTIPIRDADGALRGVLRYRPWRTHGKKMLTVRGTRLGMVPHPTRERSAHVLLVEGPADAIAARSCGLPAIAVPGTHAWHPDWAAQLTGRRVTVIMDADKPGREAAQRIAHDLDGRAQVAVLDLAPERSDGYDLSDLLLARRRIAGDRAPITLPAPELACPASAALR